MAQSEDAMFADASAELDEALKAADTVTDRDYSFSSSSTTALPPGIAKTTKLNGKEMDSEKLLTLQEAEAACPALGALESKSHDAVVGWIHSNAGKIPVFMLGQIEEGAKKEGGKSLPADVLKMFDSAVEEAHNATEASAKKAASEAKPPAGVSLVTSDKPKVAAAAPLKAPEAAPGEPADKAEKDGADGKDGKGKQGGADSAHASGDKKDGAAASGASKGSDKHADGASKDHKGDDAKHGPHADGKHPAKDAAHAAADKAHAAADHAKDAAHAAAGHAKDAAHGAKDAAAHAKDAAHAAGAKAKDTAKHAAGAAAAAAVAGAHGVPHPSAGAHPVANAAAAAAKGLSHGVANVSAHNATHAMVGNGTKASAAPLPKSLSAPGAAAASAAQKAAQAAHAASHAAAQAEQNVAAENKKKSITETHPTAAKVPADVATTEAAAAQACTATDEKVKFMRYLYEHHAENAARAAQNAVHTALKKARALYAQSVNSSYTSERERIAEASKVEEESRAVARRKEEADKKAAKERLELIKGAVENAKKMAAAKKRTDVAGAVMELRAALRQEHEEMRQKEEAREAVLRDDEAAAKEILARATDQRDRDLRDITTGTTIYATQLREVERAVNALIDQLRSIAKRKGDLAWAFHSGMVAESKALHQLEDAIASASATIDGHSTGSSTGKKDDKKGTGKDKKDAGKGKHEEKQGAKKADDKGKGHKFAEVDADSDAPASASASSSDAFRFAQQHLDTAAHTETVSQAASTTHTESHSAAAAHAKSSTASAAKKHGHKQAAKHLEAAAASGEEGSAVEVDEAEALSSEEAAFAADLSSTPLHHQSTTASSKHRRASTPASRYALSKRAHRSITHARDRVHAVRSSAAAHHKALLSLGDEVDGILMELGTELYAQDAAYGHQFGALDNGAASASANGFMVMGAHAAAANDFGFSQAGAASEAGFDQAAASAQSSAEAPVDLSGLQAAFADADLEHSTGTGEASESEDAAGSGLWPFSSKKKEGDKGKGKEGGDHKEEGKKKGGDAKEHAAAAKEAHPAAAAASAAGAHAAKQVLKSALNAMVNTNMNAALASARAINENPDYSYGAFAAGDDNSLSSASASAGIMGSFDGSSTDSAFRATDEEVASTRSPAGTRAQLGSLYAGTQGLLPPNVYNSPYNAARSGGANPWLFPDAKAALAGPYAFPGGLTGSAYAPRAQLSALSRPGSFPDVAASRDGGAILGINKPMGVPGAGAAAPPAGASGAALPPVTPMDMANGALPDVMRRLAALNAEPRVPGMGTYTVLNSPYFPATGNFEGGFALPTSAAALNIFSDGSQLASASAGMPIGASNPEIPSLMSGPAPVPSAAPFLTRARFASAGLDAAAEADAALAAEEQGAPAAAAHPAASASPVARTALEAAQLSPQPDHLLGTINMTDVTKAGPAASPEATRLPRLFEPSPSPTFSQAPGPSPLVDVGAKPHANAFHPVRGADATGMLPHPPGPVGHSRAGFNKPAVAAGPIPATGAAKIPAAPLPTPNPGPQGYKEGHILGDVGHALDIKAVPMKGGPKGAKTFVLDTHNPLVHMDADINVKPRYDPATALREAAAFDSAAAGAEARITNDIQRLKIYLKTISASLVEVTRAAESRQARYRIAQQAVEEAKARAEELRRIDMEMAKARIRCADGSYAIDGLSCSTGIAGERGDTSEFDDNGPVAQRIRKQYEEAVKPKPEDAAIDAELAAKQGQLKDAHAIATRRIALLEQLRSKYQAALADHKAKKAEMHMLDVVAARIAPQVAKAREALRTQQAAVDVKVREAKAASERVESTFQRTKQAIDSRMRADESAISDARKALVDAKQLSNMTESAKETRLSADYDVKLKSGDVHAAAKVQEEENNYAAVIARASEARRAAELAAEKARQASIAAAAAKRIADIKSAAAVLAAETAAVVEAERAKLHDSEADMSANLRVVEGIEASRSSAEKVAKKKRTEAARNLYNNYLRMRDLQKKLLTGSSLLRVYVAAAQYGQAQAMRVIESGGAVLPTDPIAHTTAQDAKAAANSSASGDEASASSFIEMGAATGARRLRSAHRSHGQATLDASFIQQASAPAPSAGLDGLAPMAPTSVQPLYASAPRHALHRHSHHRSYEQEEEEAEEVESEEQYAPSSALLPRFAQVEADQQQQLDASVQAQAQAQQPVYDQAAMAAAQQQQAQAVAAWNAYYTSLAQQQQQQAQAPVDPRFAYAAQAAAAAGVPVTQADVSSTHDLPADAADFVYPDAAAAVEAAMQQGGELNGNALAAMREQRRSFSSLRHARFAEGQGAGPAKAKAAAAAAAAKDAAHAAGDAAHAAAGAAKEGAKAIAHAAAGAAEHAAPGAKAAAGALKAAAGKVAGAAEKAAAGAAKGLKGAAAAVAKAAKGVKAAAKQAAAAAGTGKKGSKAKKAEEADPMSEVRSKKGLKKAAKALGKAAAAAGNATAAAKGAVKKGAKAVGKAAKALGKAAKKLAAAAAAGAKNGTALLKGAAGKGKNGTALAKGGKKGGSKKHGSDAHAHGHAGKPINGTKLFEKPKPRGPSAEIPEISIAGDVLAHPELLPKPDLPSDGTPLEITTIPASAPDTEKVAKASAHYLKSAQKSAAVAAFLTKKIGEASKQLAKVRADHITLTEVYFATRLEVAKQLKTACTHESKVLQDLEEQTVSDTERLAAKAELEAAKGGASGKKKLTMADITGIKEGPGANTPPSVREGPLKMLLKINDHVITHVRESSLEAAQAAAHAIEMQAVAAAAQVDAADERAKYAAQRVHTAGDGFMAGAAKEVKKEDAEAQEMLEKAKETARKGADAAAEAAEAAKAALGKAGAAVKAGAEKVASAAAGAAKAVAGAAKDAAHAVAGAAHAAAGKGKDAAHAAADKAHAAAGHAKDAAHAAADKAHAAADHAKDAAHAAADKAHAAAGHAKDAAHAAADKAHAAADHAKDAAHAAADKAHSAADKAAADAAQAAAALKKWY